MSRLPSKWRKVSGQGLLGITVLPLLLLSPAFAAGQSCALKQGPLRTVVRVNDAESITLEDGSEVRLAGILSPRARDGNAASGSWPPETDASATLSAMLLGQAVELGFGATRTDRYERHVAHLFLGKGTNRVWVQGALLSSGHARAHALPGATECLPELLAHERVARQGRLGLWRVGLYRPKSSARVALLMYLRSSFQLVAGRVNSVSHTKGGIYLNFGADWRQDFTVHIPKSVTAANPDWAGALDGFKDKYIEVRGWIERRNGPAIAISHPSEIEILPFGVSQRFRWARPESSSTRSQPRDAIPGPPDRNQPPAPNEERPEPRAPGAVDL